MKIPYFTDQCKSPNLCEFHTPDGQTIRALDCGMSFKIYIMGIDQNSQAIFRFSGTVTKKSIKKSANKCKAIYEAWLNIKPP